MLKEIEEYLENLKSQGKSINTLDAYKRDLFKFNKYLEDEGLELEKFEELQIVSYTEQLMFSGISKSSIIRNIVTIRNLYKFLRRQGYIMEAPILYYELPKLEKEEPRVMTEEEISKLLSAPNLNRKQGKRDKAILEIMYATGIKVTELIGLNLDDVNLEEGYILCRGGKVKERLIPLGMPAINALKDYFSVRDKIAKPGTAALFTANQGETITRQGIWKLLKGYIDKVGINSDINLNTLRSSFAVHLLNHGANVSAVSQMMGHTDVSVTMRYEELNRKSQLMEIYRNAHPRA